MTRSALVVGLDAETRDRLVPVLERNSLVVENVSQARLAASRAAHRRFSLIACAYPLPDMMLRPFGRTVRRAESASRDAALLVLTLPDMSSEARLGLPRGRALVMSRTDPQSALDETIVHLLWLAPRRESQAPVVLRIELDGEPSEVAARVVNLSSSGMLVNHSCPPPVRSGCSFEIRLSDDLGPLRGSGEVVRHTSATRERVRGFAVRFTELMTGCNRRLDAYLGVI